MIYSCAFFLIFLVKYFLSNKNSISRNLYAFFSFLALISLFHLDISINDLDILNIVNFLFILICLIIMIDSFNNHLKVIKIVGGEFNTYQKSIIWVVTFLGILALFINLYLVYKIYTYQTISEISITVLKNETGADEYFKLNEPRLIRTFSHFISPFGYFFLILHFYYAHKNSIGNSLFYLLLSFLIPLHGMQGLSRAAPSQYIIVYIFLYLYLSNSFSDNVKRFLNRFLFATIIIIGSYFIATSYSRFAESYFYVNKLDGETNVYFLLFYSFIDYLTQWVHYGIDSLNYYSYDIEFVFSNFRPLFNYLFNTLGFDFSIEADHFEKIYGHYSTRFIGLIPTLIFDSGYLFTFLFVLFFRFLVKKKLKRNFVYLNSLLKLPLFLSLVLMSFANAWLAYMLFHLAIIYIFVLGYIFSLKRIQSNGNVRNNENFNLEVKEVKFKGESLDC